MTQVFAAEQCGRMPSCVSDKPGQKSTKVGPGAEIRSANEITNCAAKIGDVCSGGLNYPAASPTEVVSLVRFQPSVDADLKVKWKCFNENNIVVITLKEKASATSAIQTYRNCSDREWIHPMDDLPPSFLRSYESLDREDAMTILIAVVEQPAQPEPNCLPRVIIAEAFLPRLKKQSSWLILYKNQGGNRIVKIGENDNNREFGDGAFRIDGWPTNNAPRCLRVSNSPDTASTVEPIYELVF
jgi:hypothetical protein